MKFLHLRESEIFIACDWNFNLPSGHDVLSNLLKMSNDSYNFQPLLTVVNHLALDYIFQTLPKIGHLSTFQFVGPSQSMIYCFMLDAVCTTLMWGEFCNSFVDFIGEEGIPLDLKSIQRLSQVLGLPSEQIGNRVQSICLEHRLFLTQLQGINVE